MGLLNILCLPGSLYPLNSVYDVTGLEMRDKGISEFLYMGFDPYWSDFLEGRRGHLGLGS